MSRYADVRVFVEQCRVWNPQDGNCPLPKGHRGPHANREYQNADTRHDFKGHPDENCDICQCPTDHPVHIALAQPPFPEAAAPPLRDVPPVPPVYSLSISGEEIALIDSALQSHLSAIAGRVYAASSHAGEAVRREERDRVEELTEPLALRLKALTPTQPPAIDPTRRESQQQAILKLLQIKESFPEKHRIAALAVESIELLGGWAWPDDPQPMPPAAPQPPQMPRFGVNPDEPEVHSPDWCPPQDETVQPPLVLWDCGKCGAGNETEIRDACHSCGYSGGAICIVGSVGAAQPLDPEAPEPALREETADPLDRYIKLLTLHAGKEEAMLDPPRVIEIAVALALLTIAKQVKAFVSSGTSQKGSEGHRSPGEV